MLPEPSGNDDSLEPAVEILEHSQAETGEGLVLVQPTDAVTRIEGLIGTKAVLLTIPKGEKSPVSKGWNKMKVEETRGAGYRIQLLDGNIGVLLGQPSDGLCAIDIDDDAAVEPFLAINPDLRLTLRTHGARGQQIWVKVDGDYPQLTKLKTEDGKDWGEWRATGGQSVIYGVHPNGNNYTFISEAPPIQVRFAEINWPKELGSPFALHSQEFAELTKQFGAPFQESEKGGLTINHQWFVHRYLIEHLVVFEAGYQEFYEFDPTDGLWKRQSEDRVSSLLKNGQNAGRDRPRDLSQEICG